MDLLFTWSPKSIRTLEEIVHIKHFKKIMYSPSCRFKPERLFHLQITTEDILKNVSKIFILM